MIYSILIAYNTMPLSFRQSRSTKISSTHAYIPGTALFGGLAAAHRRLNLPEEEFNELFMSDNIIWSNLYPANFSYLTDNTIQVQPLPASARSCKRFSGFKPLRTEDADPLDPKHGIADHLIPWTLFALDTTKKSVFKEFELCNEDDFPMTPISGFYRSQNDKYEMAYIEKTIQTHTGISRKRGTVIESILYNIEMLSEKQTFSGIAQFKNDDIKDKFEHFLEKAVNHHLIYLGNSKSRGMGHVSLELFSDISPDTSLDLKNRVMDFNHHLKTISSKHNIELNYRLFIPILLTSDLILKDEFLHSKQMLEASDLENSLKINGFNSVYSEISTKKVMGWNALYGIPKSDETAIEMGSVFVFGFNGNIDDSFWQALLNLELNGLGERRREGFGRLVIAHPFHKEVKQI